MSVGIELHHAVSARIHHFVAEDAGAAVCLDLLDCVTQYMAETMSVEQVVAQNEATRFAAKKLFAQYKSLRKSVRHELNFVLQAHA